MSRRGGGPRPTRAGGPFAGSVLALSLWALVAHNSGSGWVQALGCLLAGFVVVGLFGPALAVSRLRVTVESNPSEGTEGLGVRVVLGISAPGAVRGRPPCGGPTVTGEGDLELQVVPDRRGAIEHLELDVSSASPFGLLWWHKTVRVALPRPLWVAPTPGAPDAAFVSSGTPRGGLEVARHRDGALGEPRGVRPYAAGDPRRLVHWPATAHRGELMVREAERPDAAVPHLRVALLDDGPAGDAAARRALGTLLELLGRSSPVMVSTLERDGPRTEPVYGPADARRRMARAVAATGR